MPLILFELNNRILNVALNRVSALNAVNSDLLKELEAELNSLFEDINDIEIVVEEDLKF